MSSRFAFALVPFVTRVPDAVQRAAFRLLNIFHTIRRGALLIRIAKARAFAVPGLQRITPR
jgi:hypothetical protein